MNLENKKLHYEEAVKLLGIKLKGKNNLYTSHNGHMYSFLGKEDVLAVRLSKQDKQDYEKKHGTGDVIQYGAVMRGYVPVVDDILKDTKKFAALIKKGLEFVNTLEPT